MMKMSFLIGFLCTGEPAQLPVADAVTIQALSTIMQASPNATGQKNVVPVSCLKYPVHAFLHSFSTSSAEEVDLGSM